MASSANGLVVQCGGPTAVVNASLAGLVEAWRRQYKSQLFGARWGFRGLVACDWIDLTSLRDTAVLRTQAGAALGSARDPLPDEQIVQLVPRLASAGVSVLFVIGGNGALTAAHRLAQAAARHGSGLRVIGVPKTIDNDIQKTDVAPGYGSAARFVARAVHDVALDLHSMRGFDDVAVVEVMGRHTGWLAAAAALARWQHEPVRPLILVPERRLDEGAFVAAVRERHATDGVCLIVAAEGVRDREGRFLAESGRQVERDGTGQQLLSLAGGPAPYLARLVRDRLGLRCRQIRPDVVQRSNGALASVLDRNLAERSGLDAVKFAEQRLSDAMVALRRNGTTWHTEPVALDRVSGAERLLTASYLAAPFDISPSFVEDMRCFLDDWRPGAVVFSDPQC